MLTPNADQETEVYGICCVEDTQEYGMVVFGSLLCCVFLCFPHSLKAKQSDTDL